MTLRYLQDLWNEPDTQGMDEPELLRYRSNLLGRDLRLTNFGGGNTSTKVVESDPVTGERVEVLWVKGSGGDLGTIKRDGFATLYQSKLLALKQRYAGVAEEDAMADKYPLCVFGANPRAASIDTPLHAFLPFAHVDHLHPDWAIALAAAANGRTHLKRLEAETGIKLAWLPWKRPGFELGLWLEAAVAARPDLDGIILGSHGIFTWGDTSRDSYLNTLRVIDAIGHYVLTRIEAVGGGLFGGQVREARDDKDRIVADILPILRGLIGNSVGHYDCGQSAMRFVNSARASVLAWQGTSCPDHFVRTKVRPMFVDWDGLDLTDLAAQLEPEVDEYKAEYAEYYEENKRPDSPGMRSAAPSVVLIPGIGLFSFGKSKTEARITSEFYVNAIHVMEGATALAGDEPMNEDIDPAQSVDNYVSLPMREAFDIEYWLLEEAKLKRMPPEKEMSRKVAVLIGAGPGIGHHVANLLLAEGAHLVVADINGELADVTGEELRRTFGSDNVWSAGVDVTDRSSVRTMLDSAVRQFGGLDIVINLAAIFVPPDPATGGISDELWRKTIDINLIGNVILAEEAQKVIARQGTKGAIVLTSSANGVVPKKGSVAYDVSKAGLNHLVRELAVEFAPNTRVNAVAPATVVEGSQQFYRERVVTSLAKYGIEFSDSESLEDLRAKLANFYALRTMLKEPVSPARVADAIYLMASDRLQLTTGHILPVDAGLWEAFLR